jgi:DNA-binding NarL/FixJ family response regulator
VTPAPTIVVVDDHSLVAEALAMAMRARRIAASAVVPAEFVEHLDDPAPAAGLVLLDLDLGPGLDGAALVPRLRSAGWQVLLLTGSLNETRIAVAVAAGALGWVSKSTPFEHLVESSIRAATGGRMIAEGERVRLLALARIANATAKQERERLGRLTPREKQVVSRIVAGRRPAVIAEEFVVSIATVRTQIRSIFAKLEVGSQLEVAALAHRWPER